MRYDQEKERSRDEERGKMVGKIDNKESGGEGEMTDVKGRI